MPTPAFLPAVSVVPIPTECLFNEDVPFKVLTCVAVKIPVTTAPVLVVWNLILLLNLKSTDVAVLNVADVLFSAAFIKAVLPPKTLIAPVPLSLIILLFPS